MTARGRGRGCSLTPSRQYIQSINEVARDALAHRGDATYDALYALTGALRALISHTGTAEAAAPKLSAALAAAATLANSASPQSEVWCCGAGLLMEVLFLEGARPLHRGLLIWLRRLPAPHVEAAGGALGSRLATEASAVLGVGDIGNSQDGGAEPLPLLPPGAVARGLLLTQAVLSLLLLPEGRHWVSPAAPALLSALAAAAHGALTAPAGGVLSAAAMELVVDTVSALHYLLQYHGPAMCSSSQGRSAVAHAATAMLSALRGGALARDALGSAAVVVWTAALLPDAEPRGAALAFAAGLMPGQLPQPVVQAAMSVAAHGGSSRASVVTGAAPECKAIELLAAWQCDSLIKRALDTHNTSLSAELAAATPLARVCALRGLLTAMPPAALLGNLGMPPPPSPLPLRACGGGGGGGGGSAFTFLLQCVLPAAIAATHTAPDVHHKYQSISVICGVLSRARHAWIAAGEAAAALRPGISQCADDAPDTADIGVIGSPEQQQQQRPQLATENGAAINQSRDGSPAAAAAVAEQPRPYDTPGTCLPWLYGDALCGVLQLLWAHMDEPMPQTLGRVHEAFAELLMLLVAQDGAVQALRITPGSLRSLATSGGSAGDDDSQSSSTGCGVVPGIGSFHDLSSLLDAAARAALAIPPTRKGRNGLLAALLPHIGCLRLLALSPGLVSQVLQAMQDDMLASSAAGLYSALLSQLRREIANADADRRNDAAGTSSACLQQQQQQQQQAPGACSAPGHSHNMLISLPDDELRVWCTPWLPQLLQVLLGDSDRHRTYVANHALPVVLHQEPRLLQSLVAAALGAHNSDSPHNAVAALVVVLRAARRLQLLGSLDELLPVSDSNGGIDDDNALQAAKGTGGALVDTPWPTLPAQLLLEAATSASTNLSLEALELACASARLCSKGGAAHRFLHASSPRSSSEPPGALELAIARRWLTLCLRCTGAGFRSKSLAVWEKLLVRQRAAVHAIQHRAAGASKSRPPGSEGSAGGARATRRAIPGMGRLQQRITSDETALERQHCFVKWLSGVLIAALYPGSPYERKFYALQLLVLLLQQWQNSVADDEAAAPGAAAATAATAATVMPVVARDGGSRSSPLCSHLLSDDAVRALLACLEDSWDRLRMAAAAVLELLPSPLSGYSDAASLLQLLQRAVHLAHSPRICDSDAGARLLRLLLLRYGLGLGWCLSVHPEPAVRQPTSSPECAGNSTVSDSQLAHVVLKLLGSLSGLLRSQLAAAAADVGAASRHGFVHGTLLCLRYVVEALPWRRLEACGPDVSATITIGAAAAKSAACLRSNMSPSQQESVHAQMQHEASSTMLISGLVPFVLRAWLADLLDMMQLTAELVRPHLADQQLNVPAEEVDEGSSDGDIQEDEDDAAGFLGSAEAGTPLDAGTAAAAAGSGPAAQLLTTASWSSWKEAAWLMSAIAQRLHVGGAAGALLTAEQLARMGDMQLSVMLAIKHNGAVQKSQPALRTLLNTVQASVDASMRSLPAAWLSKCLARINTPGQCRDDIVRRSSGIPYAVWTLFLSEPTGVPRQLLPSGMEALLKIAGDETAPEPWPRVHAFNVLRQVFKDASMAHDASGWHASGVAAAVRGMAADEWEVRNAASLAFTALVLRLLGYQNPSAAQQPTKPLQMLARQMWVAPDNGRSSSIMQHTHLLKPPPRAVTCTKSPTAADLLCRHPTLHGTLLHELKAACSTLASRSGAVGDVGNVSGAADGLAAAPPSLFPVLVLLSRLKPALLLGAAGSGPRRGALAALHAGVASDATTSLAAAVCDVGAAAHLGVRRMAAAALPPVVDAPRLLDVCDALVAQLPSSPDAALSSSASSSNELHGALLQLGALLSAVDAGAEGSGRGADAVRALAKQLLPQLAAAAWLAGYSLCSSAVRQAFMNAAGQLLVLILARAPDLLQGLQDGAPGTSTRGGGDASVDEARGTLSVTTKSSCLPLQELAARLTEVCEAAVGGTLPREHACRPLSGAVGSALQCAGDAAGAAAAAAAASAATTCADDSEARDPQRCCWLRDAAQLRLGPLLTLQCALAAAGDPLDQPAAAALLTALEGPLLRCLRSTSYEVRGGALKAAAVQLDAVRRGASLGMCVLAANSGSSAPSTAAASVASSVAACSPLDDRAAAASAAAAAAAARRLTAALWAMLPVESVPKIAQRMLVVLALLQDVADAVAVNAAAVVAPDAASLCAALDAASSNRLLQARTAALGIAAREARLVALASSCIARSGQCADTAYGTTGQPLLDRLLELLESSSQPVQHEDVRAAAAAALHSSGLLWPLAAGRSGGDGGGGGVLPHCLAVQSLRAWGVALRLFEDEDDAARLPAAAAAEHALAAMTATASTLSPRAPLLPEAGSACVEAVQREVYASLLARCTEWQPALLPDVCAMLSEVIFSAAAPLPAVLGVAASGNHHAARQRLFQREAENHHEELLLLAQHAAGALRSTLRRAAALLPPTDVPGLSAWRAAAAQFLRGVASRLQQGGRCTGPASAARSGVISSDHPEVFVPLCRCLLALWASTPAMLGTDAARTDVLAVSADAAGLLSTGPSLLLHPVLTALMAPPGGNNSEGGNDQPVGVLFLLNEG